MLSIIIPAQNEELYLNRTIENIYDTVTGEIEVVVVLNGYEQKVDERANVIKLPENTGERVAMNRAAKEAKGTHLLRIDAHCDFSPAGWDEMLTQVTPDRTITVAVLTALYHSTCADDKQKAKAAKNGWQDWDRLPGHWYGFCRLIKSADEQERIGLEAKWQKANRDHNDYNTVEPNMSFTGCGFCLKKDFYNELGGADESLPKMGAIGEEFGIKAWLAEGGKCQTRTDVVVGHLFGTGGYPTGPVKLAQQMLYQKYGDRYAEIAARFPHFEGLKLVKADQPGKDVRTVIVERVDALETKHPETEQIIRRKRTKHVYVWLENEHPEESAWTEAQIREKYADLAVPVGEPEIEYVPDGAPAEA